MVASELTGIFILQVLALDSLDLGSLNKPMGMYPRIALFDYESMKKMVDAISVNMGAGEISYHGASVRLEENISKDIVCAASGTHKSSSARPSLSTKRVQLPPAPTLRTSYNKPGPQDFSNHIRAKYPSIVSNIYFRLSRTSQHRLQSHERDKLISSCYFTVLGEDGNTTKGAERPRPCYYYGDEAIIPVFNVHICG